MSPLTAAESAVMFVSGDLCCFAQIEDWEEERIVIA